MAATPSSSLKDIKLRCIRIPDGFFCQYQRCSSMFYTEAALQCHFKVCHPQVEWKLTVHPLHKPGAMKGLIVSEEVKPKRLKVLTNGSVNTFSSEEPQDPPPSATNSTSLSTSTAQKQACKKVKCGMCPKRFSTQAILNFHIKKDHKHQPAFEPAHSSSTVNIPLEPGKDDLGSANTPPVASVDVGNVQEQEVHRLEPSTASVCKSHGVKKKIASKLASDATPKKGDGRKELSFQKQTSNIQRERQLRTKQSKPSWILQGNGKMKSSAAVSCPQCQKVLSNKHILKTHLNIHLAERPFKCPRCEYAAIFKFTLERHLRSTHGIKKEEVKMLAANLAPRSPTNKIVRPSTKSASNGNKSNFPKSSRSSVQEEEVSKTSVYACAHCPFRSHSNERLVAHRALHEKGADVVECIHCHWVVRRNLLYVHFLRRHPEASRMGC